MSQQEVPFGIRCHDYGKFNLADFGAGIAKSGASHVQLAPTKALLPGVFDLERLEEAGALQIKRELDQAGIAVSVLGCYVNLINPEPALRARETGRFIASIRAAKYFGDPVVGTETGSVRADYKADPANEGESAFQDFVKELGKLVEEAEKVNVRVAIEAVRHHTICTPARMKRVLDDLKSPNLYVILDPVNLLGLDNVGRRYEVLKEAVDLFADRVRILHLKDYDESSPKLAVVPPGKGGMDYEKTFKIMASAGIHCPAIVEDCAPAALSGAVTYLRASGLGLVATKVQA